MDIILAVGSDEYVRPTAERLSGLLWAKGIGNALRIWDGIGHDWSRLVLVAAHAPVLPARQRQKAGFANPAVPPSAKKR